MHKDKEAKLLENPETNGQAADWLERIWMEVQAEIEEEIRNPQ